MQAALFISPGKINVCEYKFPSFEKDELLIKIGACGVCGTDYHIYSGEAPAKAPVIIGHEFVGEVVDTGKAVKDFNVGDKVAINPNIHCGHCEYCRDGRINLCLNLKALGVTINGGFAEYSVVPQSQVYLLPRNMLYEQAVFAEPLSCCLHGLELADIKFSDNVVIIGAGTIGLLMLQLCGLKGAKQIIVVEPFTQKRNFALKLKAGHALDPLNSEFKQLFKEIYPSGADVVIECAGNQPASEMALQLVKKGGRIVLFGLSGPSAKLDIQLQSFFHKELTIKSSLLNPYTFQTAVDLLAERKINTDIINPLAIPLSSNSLESLFNGVKETSVIKYMIKPN